MKYKFPVSFFTLILFIGNLFLPQTAISYSVSATPVSQSAFANTGISSPYQMDYDGSGNIYLSDGSSEIRKYDSSGTFITQFGNGSTGVAVASNGDIIVVNYQQDKIDIYSSSGTFISSFGSTGTGNNQFSSPYAAAVDSNGNLYIADAGNSRIQKFNSSYTYVSTITGNGSSFDFPEVVAVDASDNVYVLDSGNNRVQKFNSSGTFIFTITGNSGNFNYPEGMTVDPDGNVFVSDSGNARIQVFDSSGNFAVQLGSSGTGLGQFLYPIGLLWHTPSNSLIVGADTKLEKWTFDRTDATVTIDSIGNNITNDTTPRITGTVTDSVSTITSVEYSMDGGSFTACTPEDGAFDETSEAYICNITQSLTNELHQVRVRSTDAKSNTNSGGTLPAYSFNVDTGYSPPGNDTGGGSNSETDYQIPQTDNDGNAQTEPLTPSGDSNTGDQEVVVIIEEGTLSNDGFLSAVATPAEELLDNTSDLVSNSFIIDDHKLGFYTSPDTVAVQVGGIQKIWFMTYPPIGSNKKPALIIPELQKKASILSLSYLDSYLFFPGNKLRKLSPSSLVLAFSTNGTYWKLLPNSILDPNNRTVSILQKIGGYYMIVSLHPRVGIIGEISTPAPTYQTENKSILSPTHALRQIENLRDNITNKFSLSPISAIVDILMNPFIRYGLITVLLAFFIMILFIIHKDKQDTEDILAPKEFNHQDNPMGYGVNWPSHKPGYH